MKGSFIIQGKPQYVPHELTTTFKLRDYSTAKLSLNIMGDYDLTVPGNPYLVNTARRSPYYKPATDELTKRMINTMDTVVSSYVDILEKCETPQSYTLYKNRLDNLKMQYYTRKTFQINQPTKESVKQELEAEAKQKFYSLFRTNTTQIKEYVDSNLQDAYSAKLKHWEELKAYFELVENTVEKRENEKNQKEYDKTKTTLENFVFGPDAFVEAHIRAKNPSLTLPSDVDVSYEYNQKEGTVEVVAKVPDRLLIGIPTQKFALYATGKLQVKTRSAAEMSPMYTDFYLGEAFYLASFFFQISCNIKTVRVALVNKLSNLFLLWIGFDRDRFSSINFSRDGVFNEAMTLPNVMVLKGYDIVELPKDKFFEKVGIVIDSLQPKPLPQKPQKDRTIKVSISDAKLLYTYYPTAHTLGEVINRAEIDGLSTIEIDHRFEGTLDELREARAKGTLPKIDKPEPLAIGEQKEMNEKKDVLSLQPPTLESSPANSTEVRSVTYRKAIIADKQVEPDYIVDGGCEEDLKDIVREIVSIEAPINKNLLFRKALSHLGIGRVGSRLASYMEGLALRMNLKENGSDRIFVWAPEQDPESYKEFRPVSEREANDIAPEEVSNAMLSILKTRQAMLEEELCRETARLFTFTRMGTNVVASMNDGLNKLYKRGSAVKDGDVARLRELAITEDHL